MKSRLWLWKGTGRPVGVEEDAPWRAPRCNQRETTWRDAIFEQPLSFAEHQRKDPDAIFVDEFGGDQRLQQFTAAPNMQRRPIRCLQPADLVHDITAYVLRVLPVELVEAARDDVFRRLVERLLLAMDEKQAAFVIQEHGASPNPTVLEPLREVGRVETGRVFEQAVRLEEAERQVMLRRVELHLDEPTEDGRDNAAPVDECAR